ncbi:unnamed protein product [Bursaphelenchus okinawaensis]|uniref:G_PROTEIN_RECEP_F1_2 domain-containing protein n=1 Tax=Bursaphelenchus okinawaensis TaxID=465554 RepID=A0A811JRU8_9BILA|nr:unnamed protein product [Bursaphelenchus okinawaensis]CAG9080091.1 unnamed protein product [Bursaphelenchus okinawaensis]
MFYHGTVLELCILPADFYYRYAVVVRNRTVTSLRLYIIISIMVTLTFILTFPLYSMVTYYGPSYETKIDKNATETLYQIPRFRKDIGMFSYNPRGKFFTKLHSGILTLASVFGCSFALLIYHRISSVLKKHAETNPNGGVVQVERQINKIILLQVP